MIKIKFSASKRKLAKAYENGFAKGFSDGEEYGELRLLYRLQDRVELLNQDFPVPVAELRKWLKMGEAHD